MSSLFGGEVEMKARLELGQVFETARPQGLPPHFPVANLRRLLRLGFLLRQGFGGQDEGQEGFGGQDGGQDDRQTSPSQWFFQGLP